jgi:multiple sugar transport system substrate-binding protein
MSGMRPRRSHVAPWMPHSRLWAVLSVSAFLLTACPGDTEEQPQEQPQARGEVVFWHEVAEPGASVIKDMVDQFNATDSAVTIKVRMVTGNETDIAALTAAVRAGEGPDIYMLDRFTVAQRAEQGILQDLSGFMEEDGGVASFQNQYLDYAWAEVMFEDKPYGLPFDTDARALWYNKGMLEDAGVDPAQLDPANGPITVDELREIARKVDETDESGQYTKVGFIPWADQGWHYTWGFAFGGDFFDEENCQVTPTDDGVVGGFQFMYDWAQEMDPKKVQAFLSTYAQCTGPVTCDFTSPAEAWPFIQGNRLAMVVSGDWPIAWMEDAPKIDWGVTFIPVPDEGAESATWAGGWSWVIPTGGKNPQGAWEFLKWGTGPEGQQIYGEETAHMSTLTELADVPSDPEHEFFKELLAVANSRPPLPVGALYWDEMSAALEAVALNESQPEEALQQVQERVQSQLGELCPL